MAGARRKKRNVGARGRLIVAAGCLGGLLFSVSAFQRAEAQVNGGSGNTVCAPSALPQPLRGIAAAQITEGEKTTLFSFFGREAGDGSSKSAYQLIVGSPTWEELPDIPLEGGRTASSAVAVGGKIYLLGGRQRLRDGTHEAASDVLVFDPVKRTYTPRAPIPVPVEDTVALAHLDRYIYLVGGWHDVGPLSRIQMYDTQTDTWAERVEEYPGRPVSGHAGGIVDNVMVILDGSAVVGVKDGVLERRVWQQAYLGIIDPADPTAFAWRRLPRTERTPAYRAAAIGDPVRGRVIFSGGADDGASPLAQTIAWNISTDRWEKLPDIQKATMDHRTMLHIDGGFYLLGGADKDGRPTGAFVPVTGQSGCD